MAWLFRYPQCLSDILMHLLHLFSGCFCLYDELTSLQGQFIRIIYSRNIWNSSCSIIDYLGISDLFLHLYCCFNSATDRLSCCDVYCRYCDDCYELYFNWLRWIEVGYNYAAEWRGYVGDRNSGDSFRDHKTKKWVTREFSTRNNNNLNLDFTNNSLWDCYSDYFDICSNNRFRGVYLLCHSGIYSVIANPCQSCCWHF